MRTLPWTVLPDREEVYSRHMNTNSLRKNGYLIENSIERLQDKAISDIIGITI